MPPVGDAGKVSGELEIAFDAPADVDCTGAALDCDVKRTTVKAVAGAAGDPMPQATARHSHTTTVAWAGQKDGGNVADQDEFQAACAGRVSA